MPAHPERQASIRLAAMLRHPQHSIPGLLWCCTSMERITKGGRAMVHKMGFRAGWPDWVFIAGPPPLMTGGVFITEFQPTHARILFVELKIGANQLSPEQRAMHDALVALGSPVVVRRSAEAAYATARQFAQGAEEFENDC